MTAHDTLPAFNSAVGGQWRQAAVWGTWPGGPFSASGQVGLDTQPTPLSAPRYLSVQHAHFATHTSLIHLQSAPGKFSPVQLFSGRIISTLQTNDSKERQTTAI